MIIDCMSNQTSMTEFLLLEFSDIRGLQIMQFVVFLIFYLAAISGNLIIIFAVIFDHQLHTPMYFFLMNLAITDLGTVSVTIPKSMSNSLMNTRLISYVGCIFQVSLFLLFAASDYTLLTIMAHDRYIAICNPLRYEVIMNKGACIQMAGSASLVYAMLLTTITFQLYFCGLNIIGQFFCDVPQLQKISCTDTKFNQIFMWIVGFIAGSFCTGFVFASYGYIFSVILKSPSTQGRYKTFSTCSPHLTVYSLFIITSMFSYLRPQTLSSPTIDLLSAVLYAVLPPVLNPIIYSFRNKDIQEAVWKVILMFRKVVHSSGFDCC
uniref:G-protein coupled receptors family 1 profile domain-containing protein n=1 Tax=Pseudonaja textilis TaxID=8673 RepID=A0A670YTZ8_PSETE